MKVITLFVCLITLSLQRVFETVKDECIQETNANPVFVEKVIALQDFEDDYDLMCFQKCVFVRLNTMDANGEVAKEVVMSQLPITEDVNAEIVSQICCFLKGKDSCETAFLVWRCFVRSSF
ncbi:hypothetical protein RI129_002084 [Pyrocoelia pectoralis]|uniref:Uncharacterized protein n=1 Tax=Pyrocoelia pectoralis TaxID=417401 RepID=A0AAN7ZKQ6_9COLE